MANGTPQAQETVEDTATPPDALTGWAALQQVWNQQVPANLNDIDVLLDHALEVMAP